MLLDFELSTNEVLLFDNDTCMFVDKSKLRDTMKISMAGNIGRPDMGPFVEGKDTFGNTLRAKIAKRSRFLSPVAIGKLSPSNASPSNFGDFDETKSVRSNARSLAITSPKQPSIGKV